MILQAGCRKASECKTKENQPIPLAPRVVANSEGGGGGRREDDASG